MMCQYAWFTHSWLLHDIASLCYTISCRPADAAYRPRITVKRLRGPAPGVEDGIMSSFVNDRHSLGLWPGRRQPLWKLSSQNVH